MFKFVSDDRVAELLKQATVLKEQKEWDAALVVLFEAKQLMLVSPVSYPAATWCKYPLYLQQAGRFEEAIVEFQFLLDDLERRARKDAQVDNLSVGTKRQKMTYYQIIINNDRRIIKEKMALAQKRQGKLNYRGV